ncbi:MAG: translation elongation factor Ts [Phycisphaerae bacterium]|nr:translation elongation factor Ts [Phycisphaerae bacterium]
MADISAALVKQLRELTQLPMMDCKKALQDAEGDIVKAQDILRKSGALAAAKKAGRETAEGRVATFVTPDQKAAAIVEVRCETAPVANTEDFSRLCRTIAEHLATTSQWPADVQQLLGQTVASEGRTVQDLLNDIINKIRENMQPVRFERLAGGVITSYEHHNGQVATLVQFNGQDGGVTPSDQVVQFGRDLCMHITAVNPMALSREEISAAVVAKEKEVIEAQVAEQSKGKPPQIVEKMVQGKINKWYNEMVLLEQPYVKDDKKSVQQAIDEFNKAGGQKVAVSKYLRYEVGGTA